MITKLYSAIKGWEKSKIVSDVFRIRNWTIVFEFVVKMYSVYTKDRRHFKSFEREKMEISVCLVTAKSIMETCFDYRVFEMDQEFYPVMKETIKMLKEGLSFEERVYMNK